MATKIKTVRRVAPEDLRPGQYITVMSMTVAKMPVIFASDVQTGETPVARIRIVPDWAGWPFRVVEVCLPFVAAECGCGCKRLVRIDVRRESISRVSKRYALAMLRPLQKERKRKSKKKA